MKVQSSKNENSTPCVKSMHMPEVLVDFEQLI